MTEKKISGLDELLISAADDELIINDTSEAGSGAEITKRIKLSNLIARIEKLNFAEATELTISSGSITATQSCHKIQPESETADDLATINGLDAGDLLVLYVSDKGTDTITIKHGTGNISCLGAADVAISQGAAIFYYDGTTVYLIGGGGGGGGISEIVEDTTPQLGGDLDLNEYNIVVKPSPSADDTSSGIIVTMTVDTNAEGIGAPLAMAADGHLDTADADSVDNMPCIALALETGTGSKKVLLYGVMRNDSWNWTMGAGAANLIYVSTTVGTLTQTKPTGEDDVVQAVGWALSADVIFFAPSMMWVTHEA